MSGRPVATVRNDDYIASRLVRVVGMPSGSSGITALLYGRAMRNLADDANLNAEMEDVKVSKVPISIITGTLKNSCRQT